MDKHQTYVEGLNALGYRAIYYAKPDKTGEGGIVAFKSYDFELVEEHLISMNEGTTNKDYQKDHIAVVCILKNRLKNYTLCVTNTHLYYLGTREDVRAYQTAYLLHKARLL